VLNHVPEEVKLKAFVVAPSQATVAISPVMLGPNITGAWNYPHGYYVGGNDYCQCEGAIQYESSYSTRNGQNITGNCATAGSPANRVQINVHNYNSIYTDNVSVHPLGLALNYIIKT